MIQVEGVTKRYGPKTAVSNISFEVERGEIVGFLGPNGAGKTTTMRILTGFLPPTLGTASVAGFDVGKDPIEVKRRTGCLPKRWLPRRVDAVLERTATGAVRDLLVGKLSKGYRQRVGLAQALIHCPEVLVLDEPTSGLDPKQIIDVRGLIRSLAGEHTILLSTHILPEVAGTCGRVIIINEGRIEASDTPENLTSQLQGANALLLDVDGPPEQVKERLELDLAVRKVVEHEPRDGRTVWRVEADKDDNVSRRLAEVVVTSGWGLYGMQPLGLSLEDIFLKLTSDEAAAEQATDGPPEPDVVEPDPSDAEDSQSGEGEDE